MAKKAPSAEKKAKSTKKAAKTGGKVKKSKLPKKLTVKALADASAEYNPRVISARQLKGLQTSYETFGDLSGIVLNRATDTIVSGHQRLKTLKGKKTRVVTEDHKDKYGTVEVGHIEVLEDGTLTKIPFRVVNWSDDKAEKAANIAANAHGGDFDNNKLGKLLEELEPTEAFEIEQLGLDPLTIRSLGGGASAAEEPKTSKKDKPVEGEQDDDDSFGEYDENSFEFEHQCPRCSFKW
tara:strand:- start:115873 stop:116583 length:711 start_codon:yes stop_codon:yes gene_type:complete